MNIEQNELNNSRELLIQNKANIFYKSNSQLIPSSITIQKIKNKVEGKYETFLISNENGKSSEYSFEENSLCGLNFLYYCSSPKFDQRSSNFFSDESLIEGIKSNGSGISSSEIIKNIYEIEKEKMTNNATNEENNNKDEQKNNTNKFIVTKSSQKGRKRKYQKPGNHNKFSPDNIRRKIKHLVLKSVISMINKKLQMMYDGNDGNINYNVNMKKFKKFDGTQKSNATIEYNRAFLNKTIGAILSEPISKKYTSIPSDFNKQLVENLKNDKDVNKRDFFIKFFNLTFLSCLQHYRGTKTFQELDEMKCFDKEKKSLKGEEYTAVLKYYLDEYENKINEIKTKKKNVINCHQQ